MFYIVFGALALVLIIYDLWTGDYSFIRAILEIILVYGVLLMGGIIWFVYDNNILGPIAFLIGLAGGLGYRENIAETIRRIIPSKFDNMQVDEIIQYYKSRKKRVSSLIEYLGKNRNLSVDIITDYLLKYYTKEELEKDLKGK